MRGVFRNRFFPEKARHLPGSRAWSITFRTLHLAAFGVLLGGHAFAVETDKTLPYLYLTILSGIGLIAVEMYAVGVYWLFLGKGLMVLAKLGILLAVPFLWDQRLVLLLVVVVVASVGSHMPARYRHYSVLHRRVIGPDESLRPVIRSRGRVGVAAVGLQDGDSERR